jgi:hypothetical protein
MSLLWSGLCYQIKSRNAILRQVDSIKMRESGLYVATENKSA